MKLILSSFATIGVIMTLLVNAAIGLNPTALALTTQDNVTESPEKAR